MAFLDSGWHSTSVSPVSEFKTNGPRLVCEANHHDQTNLNCDWFDHYCRHQHRLFPGRFIGRRPSPIQNNQMPRPITRYLAGLRRSRPNCSLHSLDWTMVCQTPPISAFARAQAGRTECRLCFRAKSTDPPWRQAIFRSQRNREKPVRQSASPCCQQLTKANCGRCCWQGIWVRPADPPVRVKII